MFLRSARTIAISLVVLGAGLAEAASVDENKQTVLDMTAAINARDLDGLDAYVAAAGHKRPGVRAGLPVPEAQQKAQALLEQIGKLPKE